MTDNKSLTTDISVNRHDTGMRPQAGPCLDIPSSRPLPALQPFLELVRLLPIGMVFEGITWLDKPDSSHVSRWKIEIISVPPNTYEWIGKDY